MIYAMKFICEKFYTKKGTNYLRINSFKELCTEPGDHKSTCALNERRKFLALKFNVFLFNYSHVTRYWSIYAEIISKALANAPNSFFKNRPHLPRREFLHPTWPYIKYDVTNCFVLYPLVAHEVAHFFNFILVENVTRHTF